MHYFDLHCHPTFKYSLLSASAQQSRLIDQPVDIRFKALVRGLQPAVMWLFGDPINSQSSLTQLATGKAKIISITIMALENAYTRSLIVDALMCLSNALDPAKIERIKNNDVGAGYWDLSKEQMDTLVAISNGTMPIDAATPRVRIIHSMADYRPNDLNTLHVILNFEGAHCFYNRQANNDPNIEQDSIANLVGLKRQGIRPLYITLVHHAQNALANHAFAVPTQWAGNGNNPTSIGGFTPTGQGITPFGKNFIDEALSTRNGPPVYIDVKHMSLGSRIEFYDLRRNKYPTLPIIASHMGVTGVSWKATHFDGEPIIRRVDRLANYVDVKYNMLISYPKQRPIRLPGDPPFTPTSVVTFNPWSINLFDEDIIEILRSDGLIGLSLDVRILGMGNNGKGAAHEHEPERFSLNESTFAVQKHQATGRNETDEDKLDTTIQASLAHVEYLCNNILHIVRIGRAVMGEAVWNHLCLGSDFDGLVVSIEYRNNRRTNADTIPELSAKMKQVLPEVARKMGIQLVAAGQPVEPFVERVLKGFFFDNALTFLNTHFR